MAPSRNALEAWREAGAIPAERPRTRFRMTAVFDRSQVDELADFPGGAVALTPPTVALTGDDLADRWAPLTELATSIGSEVALDAIPGAAAGYYEIKTKCIVVDEHQTANARVSTLIHELAHALVADDREDEDLRLSYAQEEVIAETVAFSVCLGLGFDTSCESVPYVADYSTTAGIETIQRFAALIDRLAKRIEDAAPPTAVAA